MIKGSVINFYEDEIRILYIFRSIIILWLLAQLTLVVIYWGAPQRSDMGVYISYAERCLKAGEWYPMQEDLYTNYIFAPGFVNYLILQLKIFRTTNFNSILNFIMNIAMLYYIYYFGKKFFSRRAAMFSSMLFCLFHSNLFVIIGANTENPFLFLCLTGLFLVFSGKWKYIAIAGIIFALANWIRPLAIIFFDLINVLFHIFKNQGL